MDILSAARRYQLFENGDRVLVAVSGGPDSVAMLHALNAQSEEFGVSLHVAHLNHGIRGEEADRDEAFVINLAREMRLDCAVSRADICELREQTGAGEEEAARDARYKFLRATATELHLAKIAVGHTSDDRIETLLMNLVRGAGVHGLGAMRPKQGRIVRPLIETGRTHVESYIAERRLSFRTDASNADTSYTRNRIRHDLIPLLERDYNPQVREALLRLARIAADQSDLVEILARQAALGTTREGWLDAGLLGELPAALQHSAIRQEILRFKGNLNDVALEQVQRVVDALEGGEDFDITLPSGRIYAVRRGSLFRLQEKRRPPGRSVFEYKLDIPGATLVPEAGLSLRADIVSIAAPPTRLPPEEAWIDAAAVTGCLRARSVLPGDRIVPFGMTGSKKLQDVLVDRKASAEERARAVVVADDEKILWVVGVVFSERGRVTQRSERAIRVVAEPDQ